MRERHRDIKFYDSKTYRNRVRRRTQMDRIIQDAAKAMVRVISAIQKNNDYLNAFKNSIFKEPEYEEHDAMGIKYLVRR